MTRPTPTGDDDQRLDDLLRSLGASDEELDGVASEERSALALELVLRDGQPMLDIDQAAARVGAAREDILRYWRALGLTDTARITPTLADAEKVLGDATTQWVGEDGALGLSRVVGSTARRLAEAVVDLFRVTVELPELAAGTRYSDVVATYVEITRRSLPGFETLIRETFRAHLIQVAAAAWAPDVDGAATRRDLAVGFADIVGYTALVRTLRPAELGRLLTRFEQSVLDVLADHNAREVKQIGDGVMFAADSVTEGAAAALALCACFADDEHVPPVRVGLATGSVLSQSGDYYGDVVNLAARLVALARPRTVVVSAAVVEALGDAWLVERLPDQALKGFGAPASVYRLVGRPGS